jgi:CTP:molybdopterin cytidylyltransferase MocA
LLIHIAAEQPGRAIMPTFGGVGGHPVLIAAGLAVDIVSYEGPGGLRQFWIDHADRCIRREVDDPGVVFDLDTPADYEGLQ